MNQRERKLEQREILIDKIYKEVTEFLFAALVVFSLFLFLGMAWGVEGGLLDEWKLWVAVPLLIIIDVCYYKVWLNEKSPFYVKRKEEKLMVNETTIQVKVKVPEGEMCNGCVFLGEMGSYCRLFRARLAVVLEKDDEGETSINFNKFPQCINSEVA